MTGFGMSRQPLRDGTLVVQVSAVNGRNLQVQVRGDLREVAREEAVRQAVRRRGGRGSITVQVICERDAGLGQEREVLAAAWRDLAALAAEVGAPPPRIELVARLPLARGGEPTVDAAILDRAVDAALDALAAMRAAEGAALAAALAGQIAGLRAVIDDLTTAAAARLPACRERLAARVREAVGGLVDADESAILRECALAADRLDLTEELARLRSHCDQFAALLDPAADEAVGRTLEFLLQEMGRELNTSGSKANDAGLANLVIRGKGLLEQMREQALNVM
jgi:uncharacterized protein YicC (UPF0701 family)